MDEFMEILNTLTRKSAGGGNSFKPVAAQGIRAAILLLEDGSVAVWGPARNGGEAP